MLCYFHLFDLLAQGGIIACTVFTGNADFLGAFVCKILCLRARPVVCGNTDHFELVELEDGDGEM